MGCPIFKLCSNSAKKIGLSPAHSFINYMSCCLSLFVTYLIEEKWRYIHKNSSNFYLENYHNLLKASFCMWWFTDKIYFLNSFLKHFESMYIKYYFIYFMQFILFTNDLFLQGILTQYLQHYIWQFSFQNKPSMPSILHSKLNDCIEHLNHNHNSS